MITGRFGSGRIVSAPPPVTFATCVRQVQRRSTAGAAHSDASASLVWARRPSSYGRRLAECHHRHVPHVSRGTVAGQCYLFAERAGDDAHDRLRILTRTTDGFVLAEEDVRLRGLGELFGTSQHGVGELRIGNLVKDSAILQAARKDAFNLVSADAGLRRSEHALLRKTVLERFGGTLELVEVG